MIYGQAILKTSLLDLLHEVRDQQVPLILGGGYGLYLKQVHLQKTLDAPTLIAGDLWDQAMALAEFLAALKDLFASRV